MNLRLFKFIVAAQALTLIPVLHSQVVFNFDSNDAGFTAATGTTVGTVWTYGASSGVSNTGAWFVNGSALLGIATFATLTSPTLTIGTTGSVGLQFDHRFSFEFDGVTHWDGGQVRISVNGGAFTPVLNGAFSSNGYTAIIQGDNILNGQFAFNGNSPGYAGPSYITSSADLGSFTAGDTIRIQFVSAWDEFGAGAQPNWTLDNVTLANVAVPEPRTYALVSGLVFFGWAARKRRRAPAAAIVSSR